MDTGEPTSTPRPTGDVNGYIETVDSASQPVIELEVELRAAVLQIVTEFGDTTISGSASGTVISLNRKATELADMAEQAVFTLSRQTVSARCQPFHERQSEALRQISQEAFEYANATDIQGLSDPRLDLDAIDRGHRARLEAQTVLSEASVLREACRR